MRQNKIAFLTCSSSKLNVAEKVRNIYNSNRFQQQLQNLEKKDYDNIFVLSGKYGILLLEEFIEPYDLNLENQNEDYKIKWSQDIIYFLKLRYDLKYDIFDFYTNINYLKYLIPYIQNYRQFEENHEIY